MFVWLGISFGNLFSYLNKLTFRGDDSADYDYHYDRKHWEVFYLFRKKQQMG